MSYLEHYGTKRHSGRYPWGSGKEPYQSSESFLGHVQELRDQGLSDVEIAVGMGINTTQLRARYHIATNEKRAADRTFALRLKDKGYSNVAIGERMGINESSVRSLLDPAIHERKMMTANTANALKTAIARSKYIDVGLGVEQQLGVSKTKMDLATAMLREEGYELYYVKVKQLGTDKYTSIKVLAPPGTPYSEVAQNKDLIRTPETFSEDGGRSFVPIEPITNVSSTRVLVRYGDEGGADKDGVIELRRNVDDISLGDSRYAQVRIGVDGTHYMKGMAIYGDGFPSGIDMIYNTSKPRGSSKDDVFKQQKGITDPFETTIRQKYYIDTDGKKRLSPINIVGSVEGEGEEGSWNKWSRTLSSQILSKQTPSLAKQQLGLALKIKQEELDEILSLTNPSVRKALLRSFSDDADAAAVHLKAAALPRQASQVLLPINSMKDNEVFAPNYRNGESVVLLRHPHGGIFEIPELIVNNKNREAIRVIAKDAKDAVGVNSKIAAKLSGADFDGDTVIVIPNKKGYIRSAASLKSLKDFDPRTTYKGFKGMKVMDNRTKQMEMGKVSNLITDMTIKGASFDEIARAVRHSMVVIDAEKHELNYTQSYRDNGIAALKDKYQGSARSGASTLISRAGARIRVPFRKEGAYVVDPKTGKKKRLYIDPKTGKKLYEETGETYVNRQGKTVKRTTKTTRMAEVDDAYKLSSGTVMENIYAGYANSLKSLANKARQRLVSTDDIPYSPSARKTYGREVKSLKAKLELAIRNKPFERQAQLLANKVVAMKKASNPDIDPDDLKKLKGRALEEARLRVGAKKPNILITDREWNAIQAGAISPTALNSILLNTDVDALKQRAMPRTTSGLSPARVLRAQSLIGLGHTRAEVADTLGISVSTLDRVLEE
jgi:DNA-binding CsgD family transcriptional regulator